MNKLITVHKANDGYYYAWDRATKRQTYLHRYVWEQAYGPIPPNYVVHHADANRANNALNNLQAMPHNEHNRMEMQRIRAGEKNKNDKKRVNKAVKTRAKNEGKNVYIPELDKTFLTVQSAVNALNLPHNAKQNINHVLNGTRQKTAYGYTWRYISA